MLNLKIRNYQCSRCGFKKDYLTTPILPDIRNVIAANCPECFFGNMVIDINNNLNFDDEFADRYYDTLLKVFNEGDLNGNL